MTWRRCGVYCGIVLGLALTAGPARADTIGPDAFGYVATNDVPRSFIDISSTGTRDLQGSDESLRGAGIGFNFSFYGTSYSTLSFSTNGLITFDGASSSPNHQSFTGPLDDFNLPAISPLWSDWQFQQTGTDAAYFQTMGTAGSRMFVVQWNKVANFGGSPSAITFETVLYEGSNDIAFIYKATDTGDASAHGASSTVGIRDVNGDTNGRFLEWSYNQGKISDGETIVFSAVPEPASVVLTGLGFAIVAFASLRRRRGPVARAGR